MFLVDALTPHKALAKIFRLFIREENFDDPDRQTFVINNLLKLMYPKDIETREKVAYMAMKVALGVTCGLTSGIKRGKVSSTDFGRLDLERVTSHTPSSCLSSRDTNQKQQPEITEKNAKIPLRHLSAILKDIFIFLFSEQPVVVLIEEAQDLDESSWKLIISLKKTQQKVFIVLMQEPIAYLNSLYSTAGSNSSIGALINPDSSIFYDWIEPYVNKLSNNKKYSYMLLPEFTFLEVRTLLANVLKVGVKDLPTGLDLMVYNLSGGNPYWLELLEVLLFVHFNTLFLIYVLSFFFTYSS